MDAQSRLSRDIPFRTAAPYLLILFLLPVSLQQLQITARWIAHEINPPAGMSRTQIRDEASGDFRTFWVAGRKVLRGQTGRDYAPLARTVDQRETGLRTTRFYYPPPTLLIMPLAGLSGLIVSFAIWTLGLLLAGLALLRWAGVGWAPIMLTLASPASLWSLNMGQFGFVTGAALFSALLMMDRQPTRAGAVIGALTLKPQAALISPFLLLADRRYRAFAAAAAMTITLACLTTLVFGWRIWVDFLMASTASGRDVLLAPFPGRGEIRGASIFWMLRSFGLSIPASAIGQGLGAVGAVIWGVRLWRNERLDILARTAGVTCLTLLLTPYAYTDDMCGYSLAIISLAWRRRQLAMADAILIMWPAFITLAVLRGRQS
ncbi:MAG: hypothetical protein B7Z57_14245 [Acidiphilium sp. 37-60-79]|nr:MAG: hypothetical protein B7Z57_14245 [Acidiphilium sp. 37-60-79]